IRMIHSPSWKKFQVDMPRRENMSQKRSSRPVWTSRVAALIALTAALLFTAAGARAGCAVPYKTAGPPAIPLISPAWGDAGEKASIVGLWHVIYTGTSNDNFPPGGPYPPTPFQFLESFKTWHADGTEFENAFVPPTGGNVCFGVWKEVDNRNIKLHHIGL